MLFTRKEMLLASFCVMVTLVDGWLRFFALDRSAWTCNAGIFWGVPLPLPVILLVSTAVLLWLGYGLRVTVSPEYRFWFWLLVCGGAMNGGDRLYFGCVLDYLTWPSDLATLLPHFNIADSMLLLGAGGLIMRVIRKKK